MARRESECKTAPIGWKKELVDNTLGPYQHSDPAGRIGVQWQRVAVVGAMPLLTGISTVVRAARQGKVSKADATANAGQKQRWRSAVSCMGSLLVVHAKCCQVDALARQHASALSRQSGKGMWRSSTIGVGA